jgi:hypothetical protein
LPAYFEVKSAKKKQRVSTNRPTNKRTFGYSCSSRAFYQHSGKDSYFWETHRLTLHDCNSADLKQAFVDIVSGIEDLRDAQATLDFVQESTDNAVATRRMVALARNRETLGSISPEERESVHARIQLFKSHLRFARSPEEAVRGLYVATKPRLGLARQ